MTKGILPFSVIQSLTYCMVRCLGGLKCILSSFLISQKTFISAGTKRHLLIFQSIMQISVKPLFNLICQHSTWLHPISMFSGMKNFYASYLVKFRLLLLVISTSTVHMKVCIHFLESLIKKNRFKYLLVKYPENGHRLLITKS